MKSVVQVFSLIIGLFFLAEGIWGLFSDVVFWVFTTNLVHSCIHILLGIAGIWKAINDNGYSYLKFIGGLLFLIGILKMFSATEPLMTVLLNISDLEAYTDLGISGMSLLLAFSFMHLHVPSSGRRMPLS